jgi:hypothetical protein
MFIITHIYKMYKFYIFNMLILFFPKKVAEWAQYGKNGMQRIQNKQLHYFKTMILVYLILPYTSDENKVKPSFFLL